MRDTAGALPGRLIEPQITETYEIVGGHTDRGLLILCDHAANTFPAEYGSLGLPPEQLERHIAYDIGAAAVTRGLARELGVPAVLTKYSRLLIDPNRGLDDPTLIMRVSDGAVVPGNRHLPETERRLRIRRFYAPYDRAIGRLINDWPQCQPKAIGPALISIHSFTESWKDLPRRWHIGVLWDADGRLAKPLLESLYAEGDLIVGDNEPYSGRLVGDTMWRHGTRGNLPHALIEIRQDLIRDEGGQKAWTARLSRLIDDVPAVQAT